LHKLPERERERENNNVIPIQKKRRKKVTLSTIPYLLELWVGISTKPEISLTECH